MAAAPKYFCAGTSEIVSVKNLVVKWGASSGVPFQRKVFDWPLVRAFSFRVCGANDGLAAAD
jgi:hypothetical protein